MKKALLILFLFANTYACDDMSMDPKKSGNTKPVKLCLIKHN